MPRMQQELSRLQFQRDFADAQSRYDMLEPEDDLEEPEDDFPLSHYFVCRE